MRSSEGSAEVRLTGEMSYSIVCCGGDSRNSTVGLGYLALKMILPMYWH